MNKILKCAVSVGLCCAVLTGCGGAKIEQNTTELEVGKKSLYWEDYITMEEKSKYKITVDESKLDIDTLGTYTVAYSIENKDSGKVITKEFEFDVVDTTAPVIKVQEEGIKIEQNSEYDALSYITVSDNHDEVTLEDVTVNDSIDVTKIGRYDITYTVKDTSGNETKKSVKASVIEERKELSIDEVITIDGYCEFYIESSNITKEVKPKRTTGYYSYYKADGDNIYVDICVACKNLQEHETDYDEFMSADLLYANKYNFSYFDAMEESSRDDLETYEDISPLSTGYIHFIFEVPQEVKDSNESLVATFNVDGEEYDYVVR